MQAAEVLTVLAEISIALAGFAGIVVALRQRRIDEFQPHELVRFGSMLGIACALLFFALLPVLFHYTGHTSDQTWARSSSVLSAGLYLACLGWLLFFSVSLFVRLVRASVSLRPGASRPGGE